MYPELHTVCTARSLLQSLISLPIIQLYLFGNFSIICTRAQNSYTVKNLLYAWHVLYNSYYIIHISYTTPIRYITFTVQLILYTSLTLYNFYYTYQMYCTAPIMYITCTVQLLNSYYLHDTHCTTFTTMYYMHGMYCTTPITYFTVTVQLILYTCTFTCTIQFLLYTL